MDEYTLIDVKHGVTWQIDEGDKPSHKTGETRDADDDERQRPKEREIEHVGQIASIILRILFLS